MARARTLERDLEQRDALADEVIAFASRRVFEPHAAEIQEGVEQARAMTPHHDSAHRRRHSPQLEALVAKVETEIDALRQRFRPAIVVARPAPVPDAPDEAALGSFHAALVAIDEAQDAAAKTLEDNLANLTRRAERQRRRVASMGGIFETKAEHGYQTIRRALRQAEAPPRLTLGQQWRNMFPDERRRLKGQLVAMGIVLALAIALATWLFVLR